MQAAISSIELARDKERALLDWFRARGSVLIGFSGGVDSTYLAACAVGALGTEKVLAVIGRSASLARSQWGSALAVAERIGVPVEELDTEELSDPRYAANPSNRCYFCKTELWGRLVPVARARGFAAVVDGTNASDLGSHRPGMAAARERGVDSPLADVGLTKSEIRALSRERGLPTWDQPAAPCLASRLPYGTAVTPERLRQVDDAEDAVRALGVRGDLRVRHHGDLARIELAPESIPDWLDADRLARLTNAVTQAGFARPALDAAGFRSGGLLKVSGIGNRESGIGIRDSGFAGVRRETPAAGIGEALVSLGIEGTVETHGTIAVFVTDAPHRLADPAVRQALRDIAVERGFEALAIAMPGSANPQSRIPNPESRLPDGT